MLLLHAVHGSTLAYSVAASRRGAVTIVDAQEKAAAAHPLTLSLLDADDGPGYPAASVAASVMALGPHVVARGGGSRVVYRVWRLPEEAQQPQPRQPQQWVVDYGSPVSQSVSQTVSQSNSQCWVECGDHNDDGQSTYL